MMKKVFFPFLAVAFLAAGCANQPKELTAGIHTENLDTSALVGTDFYQYACGGWMKLHPLTDEYSRFGSFDQVAENNLAQLNDLIKEIASKEHEVGSEAQKIGDFFNVAMDSVRLNAEGCAPIKADLERIESIKNSNEFASLIGEMNVANLFFAVYVDADVMDASKNLMQTYQAGIGMGERDYYLSEEDNMADIRTKYVAHIQKMFELNGFSAEEGAAAAKAVMKIETRLAKSHFSQVELRDPNGNYHKYTIEELKKEYSGFDWDAFFNAAGANVNEISVSQPAPVKEAIDIINTEDLNSLKYYAKWHLIDAAASYLSDEISAQNFDFYGKTLSGRQEQTPRWKRAVSTVDGSLGMAVGKLYCEKYFTAAAKERMETLVQNLLKAYSQRMDNLTWMSDETKAKAHEKLNHIYVKVGYPNKWMDYSSLKIDKEASYWDLVKRVSKFGTDYMLGKLTRPVDKDEWQMTPQTVNAYYNPTTNEICFPAGILQYPFFDMEADDAFNYGAIGVVIAHEITHGFDDQGSQFDKDGNLANWWTDTDKKNFQVRTKVMADFFSNIKVNDDMYANGEFTLGENIADHGGLQVSYLAFKNATAEDPLGNKEGYTPEQRFFLSYANVWAGNIRPEEIVRRTLTDPHALGKWRVNGALPHIQGWYDAFGITEKDPMYVAPENRVSIW